MRWVVCDLRFSSTDRYRAAACSSHVTSQTSLPVRFAIRDSESGRYHSPAVTLPVGVLEPLGRRNLWARDHVPFGLFFARHPSLPVRFALRNSESGIWTASFPQPLTLRLCFAIAIGGWGQDDEKICRAERRSANCNGGFTPPSACYAHGVKEEGAHCAAPTP